MSIILIILGVLLIYLGARPKKSNGITVRQLGEKMLDQHPETAIMTGARYGLKIYAKVMAIAFGVVLILIGLLIMLL